VKSTGKTTKQMLAAPPNAYYVVANANSVRLFSDIASSLGRGDLRVVYLRGLPTEQSMRGTLSRPAIVYDHFVTEVQGE